MVPLERRRARESVAPVVTLLLVLSLVPAAGVATVDAGAGADATTVAATGGGAPVASAVPPGGAPVVPTATPGDRAPVAPTAGEPAFGRGDVAEERGDVATVRIEMRNRTNATVRVEPAGGSASPYAAEVVVRDRDGDGRVALRLNTDAVATDAAAFAATGPDTVEVRRSSPLGEPLAAGTYRLALGPDGEPTDESTLVVRPASVDAIRVRTTNGTDPGPISSPADVEATIANGTFVADDRVSIRGSLLVELEASGLAGPLASQRGPNATARFLNLIDAPGYSLTVRENGSTIHIHQDGAEFALTPGATTVVADPRNDTYYVLVDLARAPRQELDGSGEDPEIETGDAFDVEFAVAPASDLVETKQSVESQVTAVQWATVDTPVEVVAGPNQTVVARSNLVETADARIRLESDDGSVRLVRTAEVNDSGDLVATFDLSNVSVGQSLTLAIEYDGKALYVAEEGVHVVTPTTSTPSPGPPRTTTEATDAPTGTTAVTEDSVPGFGAVATLVAAAMAVVLVVRRRE